MEKKVVGFKLKEEEFAFDIMKVIEIIKLKEITEVPTAPDFIEGVINLRGKIIPIIDLRKRFNVDIEERDKNYRIIIVEISQSQNVGIIVDEVTKVFSVTDEQTMPVPQTVSQAGGKYIESIIKIDDRIIILLDVEKIFTESEKIELNDIINLDGGQIEKSPGS
ncbi:MAG TPA: chemotaxis protein CheW [Candidatus Goldiibacteriota bacterium]|nr:chemotaxis protein CheW [Candidatus Goldiibacteriota bacterium]